MKKYISRIASVILLSGAQMSVSAADIDLYAIGRSTAAADLPNVLFVIDNTANWNTAFSNEMAALRNTLELLPENKFNIGIMFATESGGSNSGNDGGYIRAAIRTMNLENKGKYIRLVESFDKIADKSNGGASGVMMAEAYHYFSGGRPYSGNQKAKTDYTNNGFGTTQSQAVYALSGNALSDKNGTRYISPVTEDSCVKNYIIYISNGPNQQSNSMDTIANNLLSTAAGGGSAGATAIKQLPLTPSGSQSNPSDEWARFMHKSPYKIVTFTIDVNPVTSGQGPGWTALLQSMSNVSSGTYTAVDSAQGSGAIAGIINGYLSQIQDINSVFAAVSLPASANIQGAYLNQLYIGMFRPDASKKPRWNGNLKQYKIGGKGNLVDADGENAINSGSGFITGCARSFWTPPESAPDNYWAATPEGTCILAGSGDAVYTESNTPDGNIVEKGAQAYVQRSGSASSRIVKTCSGTFGSCTSLLDFNTTNVPAEALGATTEEHPELINWARGQNIDAELNKTTTEMRPSSHGDVIHSSPLALSYGSDVIVFYGSNDGMFHAVNGNQTAAIGSVPPGGELWAFMPPEFFGSIKRLRANSSLISIAQPVGETVTGTPKPYAIDGPVSAYKDANRTWVYASMRRGGRALYAFDVTNPASPTLLWKKGCPNLSDDIGCSTGFTDIEHLGQTWSTALPFKAPGYDSGDSPMLIMGGGYDNCEDGDINTCTSTSKGRRIFVMDARTGARLTTLRTARGVVGDIRIVPDENGLAKYGYAADLGGNIYRITMRNAAPSAWTITKIASLGCATATATCDSNRKFMFSPSVVVEADGGNSIYLGSGDREKPLNSSYYPNNTTVANYFFKVVDKPDNPDWLTSESTTDGLCPGATSICLNALTSAGSTDSCTGVVTGGGKGWALRMRSTEQVVTPAATRFGTTTFSTHIPTPNDANVSSCTSNLGTTHVYNLNITTATPSNGTTCNDTVAGGGLPPPPVKKDICLTASCDRTMSICIGCNGDGPIEGELDPAPLPTSPGQTGKRKVYWYIQQ